MHESKTMALRIILCGYFLFSHLLVFGQKIEEIYFPVIFSECEVEAGYAPSSPETSLRDHAILKLPASYSKTGVPTRLVYMAHGAGGGVSENSWFLNQFDLQNQLLENGYAVFDVNGGRLENFGSRFAVASAYKAWQYIIENYNVYPQIIVSGYSMGGLTSTNFVYSYSALVLAHVMYSPVLDLYEQAWQNPWLKSTRKELAEVYKFKNPSGNTFDSCAVKGQNPIDRGSFYLGKKRAILYPVPVKIWHGTGDRVVKIASSHRFYHEIKAGGGNIELAEIESDDHGLSCGNPVMNKELLDYIKRFN